MARPDTVTSDRHGQITVHHIESEPMTPQQRGQAVSALAALTRAWIALRSAAVTAGTLPLPLPGEPSNTDHADDDPAVSSAPAWQRPRKDTP